MSVKKSDGDNQVPDGCVHPFQCPNPLCQRVFTNRRGPRSFHALLPPAECLLQSPQPVSQPGMNVVTSNAARPDGDPGIAGWGQ